MTVRLSDHDNYDPYDVEIDSVDMGRLRYQGEKMGDERARRLVRNWDAGESDRQAAADKVYESTPGTKAYKRLEALAESGDGRARSIVAGWQQGVRTKEDPSGLHPHLRGEVVEGTRTALGQPAAGTTELRDAIASVYGITGADTELLTGNTEAEIRTQAERVKALVAARNAAAPGIPAFAPNPGQTAGNRNPMPDNGSLAAGRNLYMQRKGQANTWND